jgi:hypothetical protein
VPITGTALVIQGRQANLDTLGQSGFPYKHIQKNNNGGHGQYNVKDNVSKFGFWGIALD